MAKENEPSLDAMELSLSKYKPKVTKASEALGMHEGKTLMQTQADRTKVGGGYLGGPGFSSLQHKDPRYANKAWGVMTAGMGSTIIGANKRVPSGQSVWSTLIGDAAQHSSNQTVYNKLVSHFNKAVKAGKLTPELQAAINKQLRMLKDKDGKMFFSEDADILSKGFHDKADTFAKRRAVADLLGGKKVGGKKGQIFDYDKILNDTTEPELRGAGTHSIGPRLFTLDNQMSNRPDLHPAFPQLLHGEDLGQMFHPVPKAIMLRDYHQQFMKDKGRNPGYFDMTMGYTPTQVLSDDFLTHLQKNGYAEGGKVTSQDEMEAALALKRRGGWGSTAENIARGLKRNKGTVAEFMKELQAQKGYSQKEHEARKLGDMEKWHVNEPITKAEFLKKLAKHPDGMTNPDAEISDANHGAGTFEKWTHPGGTNYRTMFIGHGNIYPEVDYDDDWRSQKPRQDGYVTDHFPELHNILAHVRLKDRAGPNGEKILHAEEIQSDWHQEGRKSGYVTDEAKRAHNEIASARNSIFQKHSDAKGNMMQMEALKTKPLYQQGTPEDRARIDAAYEQHRDEMLGLLGPKMKAEADYDASLRKLRNMVPDAPHKKDWHELALRHIIKHAAENGYDKVAVTQGADHAKRYSLSTQIGTVGYNPEKKKFQAFKHDRSTAIDKTVEPDELEKYIGKEAAQKLLASPQVMGTHSLEGVDLDVGGEGMKGFYDKMIPSTMAKIGKPFGVNVGQTTITQPAGSLKFKGSPTIEAPESSFNLHSMEITPEMKKSILTQGMPAYADGGMVDVKSIGVREAPAMAIKAYFKPFGGGDQRLPVGGIDMDKMQEGQQMAQMPQQGQPQPPQGAQPPQGGLPPPPQGAQPPSNILQMTQQGQAMNAMRPPQPMPKMAMGGQVGPMNPNRQEMPEDNALMNNPQNSAYFTNTDKDGGLVRAFASGGAVDDERSFKEGAEPMNKVTAYKLFKVKKSHPGKLFPLFVDADQPVPHGKWLDAQEGEANGKGGVKSKIGALAYRPGWHAGDLPVATHIGGDRKAVKDPMTGESKEKPTTRPDDHVWAEVSMPDDVPWQDEANRRGINSKGKLIPVKAHITDQMPTGGHYRYKTNANMTGNWLIGGQMKVNRLLRDHEVAALNKAAKTADLPRKKPFDAEGYGFDDSHFGGVKAVKPKAKVKLASDVDAMRKELMSKKAK
jgi:hypothetical protein